MAAAFKTPATKNLYRIVSFDRAAEIITGRKLSFTLPSTWPDPFEMVLKHNFSRAVFAQCWCRKAVSDAMWRIYSPHGLGVRIATTRLRLQRALTAAVSTQQLTFQIQNVEYLAQKELEEKLSCARAGFAKDKSFINATTELTPISWTV
jgi:hypothetical protein